MLILWARIGVEPRGCFRHTQVTADTGRAASTTMDQTGGVRGGGAGTNGSVGARVTLRDLAHVMSEDIRVELLLSVFRRCACLSDLAQRHALDTSMVCKQLRWLVRAGLVLREPQGHHVVYRPGPAASVARSAHGATITMYASDGSSVLWLVARSQLNVYLREDASAPSGGSPFVDPETAYDPFPTTRSSPSGG